MALAVVLRLDAESAGLIDAMAHTLPERLDDDPRQTYPPHVKLAVFGDNVDASDIDSALSAATGRWSSLPLCLTGIGVFPTEPATIWLAPVPTIELMAMHSALRRSLADLAFHPHYEIGGWLPHVTVARTNIAADAIEVLATTWEVPIVGWLDALDLIRLDPVEVLSRRPLKP